MAQTGFTPLLVYSSSTATNAPTAVNLLNNATGSELAINITDGKLFYKDSSNAVQVIGWKIRPATAGGTGLTSFAIGDLIYADTTTTLAKLADVATGNALISGGVGVAPSYGKIGLTTHVSGTLGTGNGGTGLTGFTAANNAIYSTSSSVLTAGTLPVAAGGTGITTLTAGYIPYGNGTSALNSSANLSFNGTILSLNSTASTQSFSGSNLNIGIGTAFAAGQTDIYTTSTNPIGLGTGGSAALKFFTNSTEAARIDTSQNFLVGVSSAPGGTNQLIAQNQILRSIGVGTIAGSSSATVQIKANPGGTTQSGMDIYVTGFETTNTGSIYMKAQAIVHWASGSINQYGIGSTSYNESLGNGDYRAYSGASLSISNSSNNVNLTITNSGGSAINLVVVTIQEHYS